MTRDAGVIDHCVEPPEVRSYVLEGRFQRSRGCDIAFDPMDTVRYAASTVGAGYNVAFLQEALSGCLSDSTRCAYYESYWRFTNKLAHDCTLQVRSQVAPDEIGTYISIPQVCCWTVVCWLPTLDSLGLKVMHPNSLHAVCAAASTPSLRILRALNRLQVPQRPDEIAEGLELCISVVSQALSELQEAGIVTSVHGEIQLAVDLKSFFSEPLAPSLSCPTNQPQRKAIRV